MVSRADAVFVGFVLLALVVGWVIGYYVGRAGVHEQVAWRVNVLRTLGAAVAAANGGQVPWTAVDRELRAFPGQPKVEPHRRHEADRKWDQ